MLSQFARSDLIEERSEPVLVPSIDERHVRLVALEEPLERADQV